MNNFLPILTQIPARLAAGVCLVIVAGCSVLEPPDDPAYQRAEQTRNLELPPDLTSPEGRSGVPEVVAAEASAGDLEGFEQFKQFEQWEEFEKYRQWKAQAGSEEKLDFEAFVEARRAVREQGSDGAGVSVETNVDQSRDVRVKADGESTMKYVDAALTSMGVNILDRNPDSFRFDVSLPEIREPSLFRPSGDRFLLQILRDGQEMLVTLSDRGGNRVTSEPATQFMNRLASQVRLSKVRLELEERVVQPRNRRGTVRTTETGHIELDLADSSERVWSQVDYVIDQIGFTVIDRNPDEQTFLIRYLRDDQVPEERTGLEKLAFWKDDQTIAQGADIYIVRIQEAGAGSTLSVVSGDGQPSETADTILELLRDKL